MLWKHLGDEEHLITPARDGFADHQLRGARAIHLRGVDVVHSEIEAAAQGGDCRCLIVPVDVPGPLADHADLALQGTETAPSDACPRPVGGVTQHDAARVRR